MKLTSRKRPLTALVTALALGLFSACGSENQVADGGIRGTGSSVGPVSGFGSVFVNGVKFNTDTIQGRVQGNDGISGKHAERELNEGMILRVEGKWRTDGTGNANSMEYDDSLRGHVSNLVLGAAGASVTFEIYGQQVVANRQTVLKGRTLATLADNDFVRVSAWRQPDGSYRASYIGFNPVSYGDDPIELEGPVDAGPVGADRFTMNGVVIKFDDRSFATGLSADDLKPGVYFEVEGDRELDGGAIVATRIQLDDFRRYRPAGEDIEIVGPISSDYDEEKQTFELNGLIILVSDSSVLDDDVTLDDLKAGLLVQVEGEFDSDKLVRATEIEVRDGDAEVSGTISADDVSVDRDSLSVGGVRVQVTSRTIITDDDSGDRLTIYELIGPDADSEAEFVEVEVAGIQKKDDQDAVYIEALQIERELTDEPELEYEIEGALTELDKKDLSTSVITILGVRIEVDNAVFEGTSHEDLKRRLQENEAVILEVEYRKNTVGQYEALSVELD